MFNTLSAINSPVRSQRNAEAFTAISRLIELPRYALHASRVDRVSLRDEFGFVEDCLALQKLRFDQRLQLRPELPWALRDFELPALLLQPLIENAIKHGIEPIRERGLVAIEVQSNASGVRIRVSNPCDPGASQPGFGIVLGTVAERLALAYRDRAELRTDAEARFEVELLLPEEADD